MAGKPKYDRGTYKRNRNLITRYGITLEEYDALLNEQGGGCAICGSSKRLMLDHCHDSMKIRGILCGECNTAIGKLGDNTEGLRRALAYLLRAEN